MNAYIITIGDEILIGQIVDTNSAWIASELTQIGITVKQVRSVSDDAWAIENTLRDALADVELVIITGGLGPTKDDITKNTLAKYFDSSLVFNEEVYNDVISFIERRGSQMNTLNRDQALFPEKAKLLRNLNGTAPGIWFEEEGKIVVSLPGVPFEMKSLMKIEVLPRVQAFFQLPAVVYQTATITEIGESQLALKIEDWENKLPQGMKLAYLPSPGMVRLRLGMTAGNKQETKKLLDAELQKLKQFIPKNIVSLNEESLPVVIGNLLINSNKTLSTAESCTGGNMARLITSVPGSSAYFKGSLVAYANEIKTQVLGINPELIEAYGAVSQQVVEQMALSVRKLLKTHYAIATSGIAGPDGGSDEKPVGTVWIAVADDNNVVSKLFKFGNEREINVTRSSFAGLNLLRKIILNDL
ncbi:MAG: competence/damage-inducible protein A [Bacteroidetes bacterium HGW-Bacteroidetes-4]|jgi:nicotinamide-nucleotide amidase|nr:MAG: competence/damage-inducible protein A [Bacteroidetes bacterium HGW-Bacteroidetes-4]